MNAARAAGMARCTLRRMSSQHRNLGRKLTFASREMADLEFSASRSVFDFLFLTPNIFFYANQKQLCFFSIEFVSKNPRFDKHLANSPHGDLVLQPPNFRNQTDVFFSKALKNGECPSAGTWALKPSKLWRNVLLLSAPPRNESRIGWNPIRRINAHFRMLQLHTTMANWFRTMATFPKINVSHKNFIVLD